jgi:hypothetical protein
MKLTRNDVILWAPRVVGIGLAVFLALFAADIFMEDRGILGTLVAIMMHLVPSIVVLALVFVGWKHEGLAAVGFVALAILYAATMRERLAWIALVSTPLAIVSALFFYSWWVRTRRPMSGTRSAA